MTDPGRFDAVVIGTGQGGKPLAQALAGAGWQVAIVEREHVGGSCVNVGCTPTKTMVASARVAHLARRGADYGVRTGPISVDQSVVRRRKRDIVESFSSGNRRGLEGTDGLELIMGDARFAGPHEIDVELESGGARRLSAERVIVNVGLRPAVPPIEGLGSVPFLDSTSIMELGDVPPHLIVLGGGYIGLEFGQMFRRFGSDVTVVQRGPRLMPREDPDVSEAVADFLREDGVEVLIAADATRVAGREGELEVTVRGPDRTRVLEGSHLLVATGREPNTEGLGLESAGVPSDDRGFIEVNERLETGVPGIYAMGDVTGGPAYTHISYDDYRLLRANLLDGESRTTTGRLVPYTLFTDPQLGRVGLSEKEAAERGLEVYVARMPMTHVARALEMDESRGFMKALIDPGTDRILGCAVLGIEGGEIMSMIQIAMMGDLPYTALRDAVFAHPNFSEALNNLFARVSPPS